MNGIKNTGTGMLLSVILLLCTSNALAQSATPNPDAWVTNGTVNAIACVGDITYIGGNFTHVGPFTGRGVPIDLATGQPVDQYPQVNGTVRAVVSDGAGGWYIGGDFTRVGDEARNRLAHVLADGSVDPVWNPGVDGAVHALAVSGDTLYAGGAFTTADGQPRSRIAAFDAVTGSATEWNPNVDNSVYALAVFGDTVYAGGAFITVGGQLRNRIAGLDKATGAATGWDPGANDSAWALVVSGGMVYAGGAFTFIGGQPRNRLAALDTAAGDAADWNPNVNGLVRALAVFETSVYAGGGFSKIGGQPRNGIAAVDTATGGVTGWNPDTDGFVVYSLAVSGTVVCAGGWFSRIGGADRGNIALIDRTTGAATEWASDTSASVLTVAVAGGLVYAGGSFLSVAGGMRNNIAALDALGRATAWNPGADATVDTLAVSGATVYAGGRFMNLGGQPRGRLAAIDTETGGVTPWNPGADGQINALAVSGTAVYAGGYFTTIGGEPRRNLAAIDFSGGVAGWNPNPNGTVYALAVAGANVCVGGSFGSVGGQSRSNLAAIDIMTGNATSWNPNPGGTVHALAVAGTNVYLGGSFTTIGTKARNRLGAVGITTSSATDWNPDADDTVYALAASGTAVYAGGRFNNIGGQARSRIAGLDPVTGAATSWSPNPSNTVRALAVSGLKVHAGGEFTAFRSVSRPYYAQFDLPETSYLLSYLAGTGGSVTGTKVQSVAHGGDGVEVEAVPAAGYHFLYWSDGVMTTRRVDTNVTGNLTVAAVFEGNPYTLEYTAGPGGTLSGETAQIVNHRSSGTAVRAVPDTGYHFVRWSDGSTRNPRTDTSVTGNISVTAEFAINTFLLTYLSEVGGSIAGESRQTVDYGAASAPVEAVPNPGYRFVQWSDGFVQNLRTDENIRGDLVVRAEFAVNLHTLAYTAGPGGALSGAALQTVAYGASGAAVEAVPAVGRHFVRWSDGVATARRTDANVAGDLAVMAEFAINQYVLSYAADVNGAVTGPTPQTVDHGQDGASVTAVPDTGHHFVRWSDGSTQNPRTDLNVAGDVDVTAKFALNRYTLTYRAGANGTITGTAPQEVNHGEDGAPVEAVPDTGYRFVVWSDGSAQNPRTDLNVTADLTVTAAFAVSRHTLSYTAGGGGSILGASTQTVPYGSGGTAVEAVPEEGYHFVQWSDGSVGNPRLDVNVTADLAVAAEFAVNTYTLNYTAGAGGAILGAAAQTVPYGSGGTAVEAVPEEGYHFVQWSDGSVENPRLDLEVTSDLSVTAEFAADSPEGEGEGEGEPPVPPTAEEARALLAAGLVAADTDGDGSISFAEAAAAVEGLTRAVFDELDANADGVLDRAELGLDAGDGCGCGCVKSDFSPAGLRKRLGDLFLAGLALGLLAVWGARRK